MRRFVLLLTTGLALAACGGRVARDDPAGPPAIAGGGAAGPAPDGDGAARDAGTTPAGVVPRDASVADAQDAEPPAPVCPPPTGAQADWVQTAGTFATVTSIAVQSSGDLVITGTFEGTLDLGAGSMQSPGPYERCTFLARLDDSGNALWSRTAPDGDTYALVRIGPGDEIVRARTLDGQIAIERLDADGKLLSSTGFGAADGQAAGEIVLDKSGGAALTGTFNGSVDINGDPAVVDPACNSCNGTFVARLDATDQAIWSRSLGTQGSFVGARIALDAEGDVIFAATFAGTLDFGTAQLDSKQGDVCLAKFDPQGNVAWIKQFTDGYYVLLGGLEVDGNSDIVLAGSAADYIDFDGTKVPAADAKQAFVARFDPDGNVKWARGYAPGPPTGSIDEVDAYALALGPGGDIVLTGQFRGSADFGNGVLFADNAFAELFVARFDNQGNARWSVATQATQFHATYNEGDTITVDPGGRALVGGYISDAVCLAGHVLPAPDGGHGDSLLLARFTSM